MKRALTTRRLSGWALYSPDKAIGTDLTQTQRYQTLSGFAGRGFLVFVL